MSKIGRKPIDIQDVAVEVKGRAVSYKGKNASGNYELPEYIQATLDGKLLSLNFAPAVAQDKRFVREHKKFWGLHRALLSNNILGAHKSFEKQLKINGLGFKVELSGSKMKFSLGYSHKIEMPLPKEVTLEVDKTGQLLTFKSADKALLGLVCDKVRALRPPEPYKGTGIKLVQEVIIRKAGKAKSS